MLYLSTGNKTDSFTAYRVLRSQAAPDGGIFMPMRVPVQDDVALAKFESMTFGQTAAELLNLFFGTHVTGWDVDFSVGRQVMDLVSGGYKVSLAESWHSPSGTHEYLVQRLFELVTRENHSIAGPNLWFRIVVDIIVLFGAYGKYCRQEIYEFDVAAETDDLSLLLAIRYAQKMGLPIRQIILGSIDGDGMWDFVSYGDYPTSRKQWLPCLEALLWLEFGYEQSVIYRNTVKDHGIFRLKDQELEQFRSGIFATVVGENRVKNVIDSTIRTSNYHMQQDTARAFGALQDYRAKTGENKNTLLFSRKVPAK